MGMFDHIDFSCPCPFCEKEVSGFQSKDGPCQLETLKPWEVTNFYAGCRHCKSWIEFIRDSSEPLPIRLPPPEPENWMKDYAQHSEGDARHRKYQINEKEKI